MTDTRHYGIDLSSNDGHPIDYPAMVAALRALGGGAQPFVFVKATESTGYANPYYVADIAGSKAAGAATAAYLFDHGTSDAAAEVAFEHRVIGPAEPSADDLETPQGVNYRAKAIALQAAGSANAGQGMDYLNQSEEGDQAPGTLLWLAVYDYDPMKAPPVPCAIKQYSDRGQIAGVPGQVDLNVWCGTEAQFAAFFRLGAPAAAPQTTPPQEGNMICTDPVSGGHWTCGPDGGVFDFPPAAFYGSVPELKPPVTLSAPIVGMAATKTGKGYWLAGADGGVFCFGDAQMLGNLVDHPEFHAGVCVGITANPDGGYALAGRYEGGYPRPYSFPADGSLRKAG